MVMRGKTSSIRSVTGLMISTISSAGRTVISSAIVTTEAGAGEDEDVVGITREVTGSAGSSTRTRMRAQVATLTTMMD